MKKTLANPLAKSLFNPLKDHEKKYVLAYLSKLADVFVNIPASFREHGNKKEFWEELKSRIGKQKGKQGE